jgi:serine/threonine-protein kinase
VFTTDTLATALADRYTIERLIGEGGMARVFLARDLRHNRRVALKVLRPDLGAVVGVERFQAEIDVTANLQHPNLLPLFDSGEAGDLLFYVMPYVEGESLRARIEREKQLPVDEALRIATAVASALDYAHRHGVIHRDLKPENILLHDGQPLVADFGIALAISNASGARITQTGISLGTPQYMSPEQATGDRVIDGRTDIYSLGALTYEMLTGEPPHAGSTSQAIIARVLTERPRGIRAVRPSVPQYVEATVEKALEKLPADRWPTARAFSDGLQGRASTVDAVSAGGEPIAASRMRRTAWIVAGGIAGAALTGVGAIPIVRQLVRQRVVAEPVRFVLELEPTDHFPNSPGVPFSISPDGQIIAYAASRGGGLSRLYVRSIGALNARLLEGTEGATQSTFSPDGKWIAFVAGSELKKIPVEGGAAVTLGSISATATRGLCWATTDRIFVGRNFGALRTFSASGAAADSVPVPKGSAGRGLRFPVLLDDGGTVVFSANNGGRTDEFWYASTTELKAKPFKRNGATFTGAQPLGVVAGRLVYVDEKNSVVATVALDRRHTGIAGTPSIAGDPVAWDVSTNSARAALSRSGSLVFQSGQAALKPTLVDFRGNETSLAIDSAPYGFPRFSPNGRRIALSISSVHGADLWVYDRGSGGKFRLVQGNGTARDRPEWTPDGKRILYRSSAASNTIWWRAADGSGGEEVLLQRPDLAIPEAVLSPKGDTLLVRMQGDRGPGALAYWPLHGDTALKPLVALSGVYLTSPRFSPNGRWVAYSSDETLVPQVYVTPFPGGGARYPVSVDGGDEPVWSPDGKYIYYANGRQIIEAAVTMTPTFAVTGRKVLFEGNYVFQYLHQNFDLSPDGKTFLLLKTSVDARTVVVHDWFSGITAK